MTNPRAGQPATSADLVDVDKLVAAYYEQHPDPTVPEQRVSFGTSGHRGSSLSTTFNEDHILATSQAICEYRAAQGIDGPLFLGADTHALSEPATRSALEVFGANNVTVLVDSRDGYTPTPAVSLAILTHNATAGPRADGVVVTPSHNPPSDGGFKYNPPDGGPAGTEITGWIQDRANELLAANGEGVRRVPYVQAKAAAGRYDFLGEYVDALPQVVDLDAIRAAGVRIGADPLGGASVGYWGEIAERHRLDLTVVNPQADPTFRFMTLDWDGKIRMDCSSPYAMAALIARQRRLRRRHRQRHRLRPARHRHPGRWADESQPLPGGGHRLPVREPPVLAGRCGGRQDAGELVDDRPGHRRPRPAAARGPGRLQVVRPRPARRLGRLRRRGKRGRVVPAPRRRRLDHRQGRHHPVPARLGDHGRHGTRPVAALRASSPRATAIPAYARVDSPATREQKAGWAGSRPTTSAPPSSPASRSRPS